MVSNRSRTLLYIGMTNNLINRVAAHKKGLGASYARRYSLWDLVYYEEFPRPILAIRREKQLKKWNRSWKWGLIRTQNPKLEDLYNDFVRMYDDPRLREDDSSSH